MESTNMATTSSGVSALYTDKIANRRIKMAMKPRKQKMSGKKKSSGSKKKRSRG